VGLQRPFVTQKFGYAKGQLPTLCAMSNPGKYTDEMISVIGHHMYKELLYNCSSEGGRTMAR
jgi:hypothetical protein